jgi:hypothetical protein
MAVEGTFVNPVIAGAAGDDRGDPFIIKYLDAFYRYHTVTRPCTGSSRAMRSKCGIALGVVRPLGAGGGLRAGTFYARG